MTSSLVVYWIVTMQVKPKGRMGQWAPCSRQTQPSRAPLADRVARAGAVVRRADVDGKRSAAPDFVKRDFTDKESDLVWAGDMTQALPRGVSSNSPQSATCSPGACSAAQWAPTSTRT